MKPCYVIFEYFEDVKCITCGKKILTSRVLRMVTTDLELAVRFTKNRPEMSYQKETLWTAL